MPLKNNLKTPARHEWIIGRHAAFEALKKKRHLRRILVTQKFYEKESSTIKKVFSTPTIVTPHELTATVQSEYHQGIGVLIEKTPALSLKQALQNTAQQQTILAISHINDPLNLGAICRCAAAFQTCCILITEKSIPGGAHWTKVASGALEHTPLCVVKNMSAALKDLKKHNFWCLGLSAESSITHTPLIQQDKVVLIVGSEDKGIPPLVTQQCDELISIPTNPSFPILNMSHATAIALYSRFSHIRS